MARVTVRVDDELKEKMDERSQINWSEYIRGSIREKVSESNRRQIQKLVEGYLDDLSRLFALYMFAERISTRRIYETMEHLFDEERDSIVDEVERDLEDLHLPPLYKKTPSDKRYSDIIIDEVMGQAGDEIRSYVRDRVAEAPKETNVGISLLPHFVQNRVNDDVAYVKERSLSRTWSVRTGGDIDTDLILSTGLAFADYYSSNAYSYPQYRIPAYAIGLIEDIERHPTQYDVPPSHPDAPDVEQLKQTDEFEQFMKWLGGASSSVPERRDEDEIEAICEESGLSRDELVEIRQQMVDNNLLLFKYSPHRSSAGDRSSRPSGWRYVLTDPGQQLLADYIPA